MLLAEPLDPIKLSMRVASNVIDVFSGKFLFQLSKYLFSRAASAFLRPIQHCHELFLRLFFIHKLTLLRLSFNQFYDPVTEPTTNQS